MTGFGFDDMYDYVNKHYTKDMDHPLDPNTVFNNLVQLNGMAQVMYGFNDETYLIDWWYYEWPDGCRMAEMLEIASDEETFTEVMRCFMEIMADVYMKNNLYIMSYMDGKISENRPQVTE